MEPEYKAYQHSAHAQVDCVACHIGPGTTAYIRTKVNGVKQLYHQILGDFDRPIQILNPNLRLAQETCQTCHWSQKHIGDVQKTYRHFLADETNTPVHRADDSQGGRQRSGHGTGGGHPLAHECFQQDRVHRDR